MRILVTDIAELTTNDDCRGDLLGVIEDAAFISDNGIVTWVGPAADVAHLECDASPNASRGLNPEDDSALTAPVDRVIHAQGRAVIPGFVDSHNHLLFAGERSAEFAARMAGESYSAGGIRSTVSATRHATDAQLEHNLVRLIRQAQHSGTTTFELKSGYGLTAHDELRQLAIAAKHTSETTLLAAHVVPAEYAQDPDAYVDLIITDMIPAAAAAGVKWIDAFCEKGAFSEDQTRRILTAGIEAGLLPRLHANQLTQGGALRLATELQCASADHATFASDDDLAALAAHGTVATLLPAVEFSTRQPYPDARRFFAAGVSVAIASDCNPGSGFSSSIPFAIAVAVRDMHFTVEQAVWAATAGGARALRRTDVGHLTPGARADFSILDAPSCRYLAYRPGVQQIAQVYVGGELVADNPSPYMAAR